MQSICSLFKNILDNFKHFLKETIELSKTELTNKLVDKKNHKNHKTKQFENIY